MKKLLALLLALSMIGGVVACSSNSETVATSQRQAEVEQIAARFNQQFGGAGYLVGVWEPNNSEIFVESGNAKRDQHWRIASVTKTFVSLAILKLVEQKKLTLEDTINNYVPGITNGNKITIRQLLNMTAGVYELFAPDTLLPKYLNNPNMPWTVEDSIKAIQGKPALFKPGTKTEYDNSNYILLGEVIKKVSDKPTNEAIQELVIEPAGLQQTSVPTESALPQPAVPGVMTHKGKQQNVDLQNPALPYTAGDMVSTIDDMRAYSVKLAKGELVGPDQEKEMLTTTSMGPMNYGLGVIEVGTWIGHTGGIPGYVCTVFTDPKTDRTVVTMFTGGEFDNPAAQAAFFATVSKLWPGEYPKIDEITKKLEKASTEEPATSSS